MAMRSCGCRGILNSSRSGRESYRGRACRAHDRDAVPAAGPDCGAALRLRRKTCSELLSASFRANLSSSAARMANLRLDFHV